MKTHIGDTSSVTANRWLSPAQAAVYLGCSKNFLDKDRITGVHKIPFARLGRAIKYDVHDLDAYLSATKVAPVVKK